MTVERRYKLLHAQTLIGDLDLTMSPTWTGNHAFQGTLTTKGVVSGAQTDITGDTGSIVLTPVGVTAPSPATVTATWSRQGNQVTMTIPGCTGTSSSTGFSFTGSFPASIQPARAQNVPVPFMLDASAQTNGGMQVPAATTQLTFFKGANPSPAGFTNTATNKGLNAAMTFTYQLN